jgi:type I restriction enzyme R subunit
VVTVDLMTTGVDVPDLEFLVLLRPVKSRILFEQMLGRGTRLGDTAADKDHFTVLDCFDGTLIEYFAGTTGITAEPPEGDGKSIRQIIEEIWRNEDRAYNTKRLVRRLRRIDKSMTGEARELFARFIDDGDLGQFAEDLPKLLAASFSLTMQILRDDDFQRLLEDYPRGQRTFIVASTVTDSVSSEWMIKGADGKQYKPDDYITVFAEFVRLNASAIDALAILLSRPTDWKPEALLALRNALKGAPQHFTEVNLERAFRACYHKALVDIISMVKHAAADTAPLLTAGERVDAAIEAVVDRRAPALRRSSSVDRSN